MCPGPTPSNGHGVKRPQNRPLFAEHEAPPDWETVELPDPGVLRYLTDAHCHPTDVSYTSADVESVGLGSIAAMATRYSDQSLVREMGDEYGSNEQQDERVSKRRRLNEVEVVACFGYHPWFCHLLSLSPPSSLPTRHDHYASLFLPSPTSTTYSTQSAILEQILSGLPDPISFETCIQEMRVNIQDVKSRGGRVMIGEIGMDRSFRVPFPKQYQQGRSEAPKLHPPPTAAPESKASDTKNPQDFPTTISESESSSNANVLTPFRPSIEHQRAILERQFELAVEMGVNVSLHCVRAQGPTVDFLRDFTKKHGRRFLDRVNLDLHSCGGFSVEGWLDSEKRYPNLYLSPSIAISSRTPITPALIRAASPDRLLVESDTHLIRDTTRRVWACTVWIAKCKGWEVEKSVGEVEEERGVVARLSENWKRFMRIEGC